MERIIWLWNFVNQYSWLLILGTLVALLWANIDPESYTIFQNYVIFDHFPIGHLHIDVNGYSHRTLTVHFLVNDVLMSLFFFMAGKEVLEAVMLKNGQMRGRKALTPFIATFGGMVGPALIFLGTATFMGPAVLAENHRGWAIPTATDIAFSLLAARIVFGGGHPAVSFLLLLAILDDALGVLILATCYPVGETNLWWILSAVAIIVMTWTIFNRIPRILDEGLTERPHFTWVRYKLGYLPYFMAGCASWYCFQESGVHPALGLLPVLFAIPHADTDLGIYAEAEISHNDLLNQFQKKLKYPVEGVLFLFGLLNAGVALSSVGTTTILVTLGLLIGKPLGIFTFGWFAARIMGFGLPDGMRLRDLFTLGCVAATGFTVALFVAAVAFTPGEIQNQAKMGALLSFGAFIIAIVIGKICRVQKISSIATKH